MFLSRSSLIKTVLVSSLLLISGIVLFVIAYYIGKGDTDPAPTVTGGVVMCCLSAVGLFTGIYAEGISKPYSEAQRIVRKDLAPKKYIEYYKEISESSSFVIVRPRFDMLELLYNAYDLTDDRQGRAYAVSEMKKHLSPKYKAKIAVFAADEEYRAGNVEKGDALLSYAASHDTSSTLFAMADGVKKTSRARATGDAETEKKYYTGLLSASGIFKADNAAALAAHYRLYQICKDEGRDDEALDHLKYCAENGGHTAFARAAKALI